MANLSHLPPVAIALLRASLRGVKFLPDHRAFETVATRRHGDVAAFSATVSRLGLDRLLSRLSPRPSMTVALDARLPQATRAHGCMRIARASDRAVAGR